jgi:transcriptional regulator with XRE-family HTH domain
VNPLRVRQARLEKGLTLAEVAGNDVTRAFISEIEHGKSRPSEPVLKLIAARTGKPMSYFLGRVSPSEPVRELAIELERVARLIRKVGSLRGLTPSESETFRMLWSVTRFGAKLAKSISPRDT